mgnify:CR=1 FL=1
MTIVITCDEPWSGMLHTQLRYALELSKHHHVIFINPPLRWPPFLFGQTFKPWNIHENLTIVPYFNLLPVLKTNFLSIRINDWINFLRLRRLLKKVPGKIIFWRFDYKRMIFPTRFFSRLPSIYHVVDDYRNRKHTPYVLRYTNLVITTSPRNKDYFSNKHPHVYCYPQAIQDNDMAYDERSVKSLQQQYGSYILFTGLLSDANNIELLLQIARTFSNTALLLIGKNDLKQPGNQSVFSRLLAQSNVHYLGVIDGLKLNNYIRAATACIVPYHFQPENNGTIRSPLKALLYLAQYKPVITTFDCEISALENKAIYKAKSEQHFISLIDAALKQQLAFDRKAVDDYLHYARYDKFINEILSLLDKVTSGK